VVDWLGFLLPRIIKLLPPTTPATAPNDAVAFLSVEDLEAMVDWEGSYRRSNSSDWEGS
jgi:hypothetical protein